MYVTPDSDFNHGDSQSPQPDPWTTVNPQAGRTILLCVWVANTAALSQRHKSSIISSTPRMTLKFQRATPNHTNQKIVTQHQLISDKPNIGCWESAKSYNYKVKILHGPQRHDPIGLRITCGMRLCSKHSSFTIRTIAEWHSIIQPLRSAQKRWIVCTANMGVSEVSRLPQWRCQAPET